MMGYYRAYIPNFAQAAKCLTDLTTNCTPTEIPWEDKQERAFTYLKQAMCTSPVLKAPTFGEPFFLHTDASNYAVGCCLGQWVEGQEHPIAYSSMKLTPTQCAWATVEKEAFAVTWALQKFRDVIFGVPITVYVDHNPLTYLVASAPRSAKLTRWLLAIQEYNITIKYKKGVTNKIADCLSRL
jgi:RNase H-like domain found in reverse transcriptase